MKLIKAKKIYTVDKEFTTATGLVYEDDKIVETGNYEELQEKYKDAEVVNKYADKYIYPGLIDPHTHVYYSLFLFGATKIIDVIEWDFGKFGKTKPLRNKADLIDFLRNEIRTSDSDKIVCWGYYIPLHEKLTRFDLDQLLEEEKSDKKILLFTRSIHGVLVSSNMIPILEYDKMFETDESKDIFGLGLMEDRTLSGMFAEQALIANFGNILQYIIDENTLTRGAELYREQMKINGVAGFVDFATGLMFMDYQKELDVVKSIRTEDFPVTPAALLMYQVGNAEANYDDEKTFEIIDSLVKKYADEKEINLLKGIKFFFDGAILDGEIQAYQSDEKDCECEICKRHVNNWQHKFGPKDIDTLVNDLHPYWANDYSIYCHSQGDESQDRMLATLEALYEKTPKESYNFVVQHFGFHGDGFIQKMLNSKVTPKMSGLVWYIEFYQAWKDAKMYPNKLVDTIADFKEVVDGGISFSLHGDSPSNPTMPLHSFKAAVTRKTRTGDFVFKERGIDRETSLRAITSEAADQVKLSHKLGSLETGKLSSFIVMEDDLMEVDLEQMTHNDIHPTNFVLEGKEIY